MENTQMRFFNEYLRLVSMRIRKVSLVMLEQAVRSIMSAKRKGGKIIIAGNGGSATIASHIAVDLTNSAKIRATNFNDSGVITCFANDYGYDKWLGKAMEAYADERDVAILISSSGRSENIINAAIKAGEIGLDVITFSGFDGDNPLRQMGSVNFWVDSRVYNVVETVHSTWLTAIVDRIARCGATGRQQEGMAVVISSDEDADMINESKF